MSNLHTPGTIGSPYLANKKVDAGLVNFTGIVTQNPIVNASHSPVKSRVNILLLRQIVHFQCRENKSTRQYFALRFEERWEYASGANKYYA